MTLPPRPPQTASASSSGKAGGPPLSHHPGAGAESSSTTLVRVNSQSSMGASVSTANSTANSSGERHLAVWNRFFANAFSAAEGTAGRDSRRSVAGGSPRAERSRAASAARSQWPARPSDAEFVSLMSVARKVARHREKCKAAGRFYDEDEASLQLDRAMLAAVLRCDLAAAEQLLILGANPCSQTADWPGQRSPCHFAVRYVDEDVSRARADEGEAGED